MAHSFSDYLLDLLMRGMGRLSILWMLSPFLVFLLPFPVMDLFIYLPIELQLREDQTRGLLKCRGSPWCRSHSTRGALEGLSRGRLMRMVPSLPLLPYSPGVTVPQPHPHREASSTTLFPEELSGCYATRVPWFPPLHFPASPRMHCISKDIP